MNKRRKTFAKFLYDMAKLIFGGFVVATILTKDSITWMVLCALIITTFIPIIA